VVAADHDRGRNLAPAYQVVEDQPGLGAIALTQPADAGRQSLEGDPLGRDRQPALQQLIVGECLDQRVVDPGNANASA
jgi:hypothetical protein